MLFSLPLIKREQAAKNTYSFYFDRSNVDYDFLPGQYNRVTLPITAADGLGSSRFFTIASSPTDKDHLMITTKAGITDFKKAFFSLEPGQTAQFFGPMGGFVFREEQALHHVFLAGGIGITPFRSMIINAAQKNLQTPITLIASFSTPEEMVFYEELTNAAKQHPNIKIVYTITKPQKSQQTWQGETGRISKELIKKYILDTSKPTYYITGSPQMVDGTEELLEKMGIEDAKIKVEQFTGY